MVIVWKSPAQAKFNRQIEWYSLFRGGDFAKSFYKNIRHNQRHWYGGQKPTIRILYLQSSCQWI